MRTWVEDGGALEKFRGQLAQVRDLERTIGRLSAGSGNARDLAALRMALEQLPGLKEILRATGGAKADAMSELAPASGENGATALLAELEKLLVELPELAELIGRAISEEPPLALKEWRADPRWI